MYAPPGVTSLPGDALANWPLRSRAREDGQGGGDTMAGRIVTFVLPLPNVGKVVVRIYGDRTARRAVSQVVALMTWRSGAWSASEGVRRRGVDMSWCHRRRGRSIEMPEASEPSHVGQLKQSHRQDIHIRTWE